MFDNYKTESSHRCIIVISLLIILLLPLMNPDNHDERWRNEYREMQKKALFYARSCGVRGDSEIIKRAFDYSVRFWMRWDVVVRWIKMESSFIPSATSHVKARGLTQVMDNTAEYVGELLVYSGGIGLTREEELRLKNYNYNLYNIEDNLLLGFAYLKFLNRYSNNPQEALARYLAGKRWVEFLDSRYVREITEGSKVIYRAVL